MDFIEFDIIRKSVSEKIQPILTSSLFLALENEDGRISCYQVYCFVARKGDWNASLFM